MKRTLEIVLVSIGMLISIFMALLGMFVSRLPDYPDLGRQMYEQSGYKEDYEHFIGNLLGAGQTLVIISIGLIAAGIAALILLSKNRKPKIAGSILVLFAVGSTLITAGVTFITGLFYLVPGLLALFRKPQPIIETPDELYRP